MLYREITAVCSQIHTKHMNTLCGQNVELVNVNVQVGYRAIPRSYAVGGSETGHTVGTDIT